MNILHQFTTCLNSALNSTYKMNNQDLCLMWLSVWCSILQSMAFNQPGIWLNIFLRHLTGLRQRRHCGSVVVPAPTADFRT